ncbi:hypothetical protein [Jannaschia seohaensis]|uniref:Uncharacterized protein n=1 Tax=Jannaschia seohaensis TaxID=475081 RepID=A0A2Y9AYP4_9RHOB|nr:hypothetical protein [Jannaschia seohaensis]PWJ16215.1 hypothetical protein BCF38_109100 [Jannaschia seohaensis]SSA49256.1 hypothetical protein SAMN05421539_109100 [Jannaschia seohaensis]
MGLARQLGRVWRRAWRRPPLAPPDAVLILRRPGTRWGYLGRAWTVELDGVRVAKLRAGTVLRLELRSGRHRLNVWFGDEGSLPMALTLAPGETARVEAMTMARAVRLGLVDGRFAPDPLLLRRMS